MSSATSDITYGIDLVFPELQITGRSAICGNASRRKNQGSRNDGGQKYMTKSILPEKQWGNEKSIDVELSY
jgi:hypothetical protein